MKKNILKQHDSGITKKVIILKNDNIYLMNVYNDNLISGYSLFGGPRTCLSITPNTPKKIYKAFDFSSEMDDFLKEKTGEYKFKILKAHIEFELQFNKNGDSIWD